MGKIADFFASQRLALTAEQTRRMLALDSEFELMEKRVAALEGEIAQLRARLNPLPREIERLKRRNLEAAAASEAEIDLEPAEARLLTYVALHVLQGEPPPGLQQITAFLETVPVRAEALLAALQERKLLYIDDSCPKRVYNLTERGKDYLVRTKILNVLAGSRAKRVSKRRRAKSARRG